MKTLVVSIAALALVAGPSFASASIKDTPTVAKTSSASCGASVKTAKVAKAARVENRCVSDDPHTIGVVPLVFASAAVAGVVAVAVTNNDNHNSTSP